MLKALENSKEAAGHLEQGWHLHTLVCIFGHNLSSAKDRSESFLILWEVRQTKTLYYCTSASCGNVNSELTTALSRNKLEQLSVL